MTTIPSKAALIAAETFLFIERVAPGGATTTAGRIVSGGDKAVAIEMAQAMSENASPEERRAFLNKLDDEGSEWIRPIDMSPPDYSKMSASERLAVFNRRNRGRK